MAGVGRDLCRSSGPTPLPKQGHLQQAAQDLVQADLEYLQRGRLQNSCPGTLLWGASGTAQQLTLRVFNSLSPLEPIAKMKLLGLLYLVANILA